MLPQTDRYVTVFYVLWSWIFSAVPVSYVAIHSLGFTEFETDFAQWMSLQNEKLLPSNGAGSFCAVQQIQLVPRISHSKQDHHERLHSSALLPWRLFFHSDPRL